MRTQADDEWEIERKRLHRETTILIVLEAAAIFLSIAILVTLLISPA